MKNLIVGVTGGAGFVGYHAARYFLEKYSDASVVLVDNFMRSKLYGVPIELQRLNVQDLVQRFGRRVRFVEVDIRDYNALLNSFKGVDVIIHAAAQVGVPTSIRDPRLDFEVNVLGTLNVLEVARREDAVVVYCSTNKVYGENVNKIPIVELETRYEFADPKYRGRGIPESFPVDLCAHTPYGVSKLAADLYVQDYHYVYGLKTGVFRMSCIYGERQMGIEEQGWVAWFVRAALEGRRITIYGTGKQVRDILYVGDLVEAWDKFISASHVKHGVYNIGGGPSNTVSLIELLTMLREMLPEFKAEAQYAPWRPYDQKVYYSDITKLKEELGWAPRVGVREGVKKLIEYFRHHTSRAP